MFSLICSGSTEKLRTLGKECYRSGNIPVALRCFDHVFDNTPLLEGIAHSATTTSLYLFFDFMHLTCGFRSLVDADSSDDNIHKLFGLRSTNNGIITIPKGSFLNAQTVNASEQPYTKITKAYLHDAYKGFLWGRLTTRLKGLIGKGLAEGFVIPCYRVLAGASNDRPNPRRKPGAGVAAMEKAIQIGRASCRERV